MDVVLAGMKTTSILLCISIRTVEWLGVLPTSSIILKGIFWEVGLNSGLKMLGIYIVNRCAVFQGLLCSIYRTQPE